MCCNHNCQLCEHFVIPTGMAFGNGILTINLPAGAYVDGETYCFPIASALPAGATADAQVYITIGTGTATYPLVDRCCRPFTVSNLRTRQVYTTKVQTTPTSGVFRARFRIPYDMGFNLASIDGTDPAETGGGETTT